MTDFYLNCFILGDKYLEHIPVKISPDHNILKLIWDITKTYSELVGNRLVNVELYKVDESAEYEHLDYWGNPTDLDITRVHVIVKADGTPVLNRPQAQYGPQYESNDPAPLMPSAIDQLSLRKLLFHESLPEHPWLSEQDRTAKGFRDALLASDAAIHTAFAEQQKNDDIPIYNGRPLRFTEIPIQLFHPAFDLFEAKLNDPAGLTARDYQAVENLLIGLQELYGTDTTRWRVVSRLLSAVLGYLIDSINGCGTGGVIVFSEKYSIRKAYGVMIEVKNEIGTGNSDPWIQGAQSYSRYWSQKEVRSDTVLRAGKSIRTRDLSGHQVLITMN